MKKIIKSFSFAFQGLIYTFKTQNNFKFHIFASLFILSLSFFFQIKTFEWLAILLCISLVLFAELVNTSLETIVDLVSPEYHKLAKIAKDTAAASVLIMAIFSATTGIAIFYKYIFI